jgi:HK97 family phage prohead protease
MRPRDIERSVPLLDIEINRSGDGRTVTAYAATFGTPYEVRDFDGHYDETINPQAFNRAIGRGVQAVQVVYNHGMTLWGTPSERYSMPLGVPVEIRAEAKGLLTVTRYAKTPLADEVLELIDAGAIRTQSFRGEVIRSAKPVPGKNGRPVIERLQLGLKEYGPTPFPANNSAAILAVRSSLLAAQVGELSDEERAELLALLQAEPHLLSGSSADPEPHNEPAAAPGSPAAAAPPDGPSVDVDEAELAYLRLANPPT